MPARLSVEQVRQAIYQHLGLQSEAELGQPSLPWLGSLFHETFGRLVRGELGAEEVLSEAGSVQQRAEALVDRVYRHFVGPRLASQRAALEHATSEVLGFWQAVRHLCRWVVELWQVVQETAPAREVSADRLLSRLVAAEESLRWNVQGPAWSDSVVVYGTADAVVRTPDNRRWCVIELKLGRTSPEADLAQACLYHFMLQEATPTAAPATSSEDALAVVSFRPERHERLFRADELSQVRARLIELIGQLAGVVPQRTAQKPRVAVPSPSVAKTAVDGEQGERHDVNRNQPSANASESAYCQELGARLVAALQEHGLAVQLEGKPVVGPTFIRFRLWPGRGVTVRKLLQHSTDIQLRLELDQLPFMAVSEGSVVVDIPRPDRQTVTFDQIRDQLPRPDRLLGCSKLLLGVDLEGRLHFSDLAKPISVHMLAAGSTGSGKTEWLRSALASLLLTNTPETLRLLLIDPKRNAFQFLKHSRFLWQPIVYPDETDTVEVLRELVEEMERRYRRIQDADSLDEHVIRSGTPLPRIICVCDEYADLVTGGTKQRKAVEEQIQRLGQKARAAGIHLILATQQPSRKIIQGALSTNLPARVALRTPSATESRMLLETDGAERLLGNGDLLYKDAGEPRRLQGVLLTRQERERLIRDVG